MTRHRTAKTVMKHQYDESLLAYEMESMERDEKSHRDATSFAALHKLQTSITDRRTALLEELMMVEQERLAEQLSEATTVTHSALEFVETSETGSDSFKGEISPTASLNPPPPASHQRFAPVNLRQIEEINESWHHSSEAA